MKEKFQRFMYGRYGVDDFSKFLLYATLALCVITLFIRSRILNLLLLAGIIYLYFRMFSKNYQKRCQENLWFLRRKDKFLNFFHRKKSLAQQKKVYRIYICPGCKQKIRIPKGHGKVQITCPKCHTDFIKRS